MATVLDVARYIVQQAGEMSAMKLQKLVYYSQAWSLVWREQQLFPEPIQAWAGGPVIPALYTHHRKQFKVSVGTFPGGLYGNGLTQDQTETINAVLSFYGKHSAQWLSDLTHLEQPWIEARKRGGAGPGDPCQEEILISDMAEYYSGLIANASTETVS